MQGKTKVNITNINKASTLANNANKKLMNNGEKTKKQKMMA